MWKNLLTPHNVFLFVLLCFLGAAWLLHILPTELALPLMYAAAGAGAAASLQSSGINIGLPLQTTTTDAVQTSQALPDAPVPGNAG